MYGASVHTEHKQITKCLHSTGYAFSSSTLWLYPLAKPLACLASLKPLSMATSMHQPFPSTTTITRCDCIHAFMHVFSAVCYSEIPRSRSPSTFAKNDVVLYSADHRPRQPTFQVHADSDSRMEVHPHHPNSWPHSEPAHPLPAPFRSHVQR